MYQFLFFLVSLHLSSSQIGSDCKVDRDCLRRQRCDFGYCRCDSGYIKQIQHCYKIKKYGEVCYFQGQCGDHRMSCVVNETDPLKIKHCICNIYHVWSYENNECVQVHNVTQVLDLQEKYLSAAEIDKEASQVFIGVVISGLMVVCIGIFCVFVCLTYACCFLRKRTKNEDVETLSLVRGPANEVAMIGSPEGLYAPIPTELSPSTSS